MERKPDHNSKRPGIELESIGIHCNQEKTKLNMNASVQFVIICECRPFNSVAVPGLLQQIQDLNRQRSYAELGHRGIFLDRIQWDDSKGFD